MATQNNPERLKVAKLISDLENIRAYLKSQVETSKILDEEQKAQDTYIASTQELLSTHAEVFNGKPTHEIGYLNYVIKEWLERLRQYPNKPGMIYGQTRQKAYASYAELVLIELKASIAIAKGQYAKSLQDAEFWANEYDVHFLLKLIKNEPFVRLNEIKSVLEGDHYSHATLFCDYVDEISGGKLAKGWVEIERRVGRDGLTFEQAFEEIIGQPLQRLMDQFYDQLMPIAIQSVDRVVELEYEREAIQKTTGVDVSKMNVDELRNVLREALRGKIITAPGGNLKNTVTSI